MTDAKLRPGAAAASVLAGMFALGLTDNFVPFISERGSLWQFHLLRTAMALAILGALALAGLAVLRPRRPLAVLARSVFPASAMLIYFGCLSVLPIGVVVAGLFTAPLFVVLISVLVQGRPVGRYRWAAVALGFVGALLVIRPDPATLDWVSFAPVLAGLLYAIGGVATRAWCAQETTATLAAGFFALLGLFGAVGMLVVDGQGAPAGHAGFVLRPSGPVDAAMLFWIAVQAVGSLAGIALIFRGYLLGDASQVAVFEYALLVFASFWAYVLWGQTVAPAAMLGMGLIAGAGAVIALRSEAPVPIRGVRE